MSPALGSGLPVLTCTPCTPGTPGGRVQRACRQRDVAGDAGERDAPAASTAAFASGAAASSRSAPPAADALARRPALAVERIGRSRSSLPRIAGASGSARPWSPSAGRQGPVVLRRGRDTPIARHPVGTGIVAQGGRASRVGENRSTRKPVTAGHRDGSRRRRGARVSEARGPSIAAAPKAPVPSRRHAEEGAVVDRARAACDVDGAGARGSCRDLRASGRRSARVVRALGAVGARSARWPHGPR